MGNSNDETNFLYKLFLTDTQVSKIRKAFANGSSANIKFSKTQLSKMIKSRGILGSSKYHIFVIKHYFFLVSVTSLVVKINKYLWKKNQLKYKKFLV